MGKDRKNKDVSLGRRHYWTDTQGHAHRVVFDEEPTERPRATWIVLASVTVVACVVGVVLIAPWRHDTGRGPLVAQRRDAKHYTLTQTITESIAFHSTSIAAGWNDEFFLGDDDGVSLFDASGRKLDSWNFGESTAPTALAFVADESSAQNGLLLAAFADKVKALHFSLDLVLPARGADVATLPGNADDETEANNAVVRTAEHGAVGTPKTILTKSGADFRGLESLGDRLFAADFAASRVWRYSFGDLEEKGVEAEPDAEFGAPDEARGYPGLKPAFSRHFCVTSRRNPDALYVVSSGLFRVDAFDPESGVWSAAVSWSRTPGDAHPFHGASNPIAVAAVEGGFVTAEAGVFVDESTRERLTPLSFCDDSGTWLFDFSTGYEQRSEQEGLAIVSIAGAKDSNVVYVLNTDGSVDVWELK